MKLESDKILLRPYEVEYATSLYAWYYCGRYDDYFRHSGEAYRVADFQRYVDNPNVKIFCTFEKETGDLVGTCGMYEVKPFDKSCKLMLMIDDRFQKKGYMIDTLKILADFCIMTHQFHKIGFDILENNERLNRIVQEFGFQKESTIIDSSWQNGRYLNENVYYMLEDRYKEIYYGIPSHSSSGNPGSSR